MSSHFRCPSSSRSVFHDFPASLWDMKWNWMNGWGAVSRSGRAWMSQFVNLYNCQFLPRSPGWHIERKFNLVANKMQIALWVATLSKEKRSRFLAILCDLFGMVK